MPARHAPHRDPDSLLAKVRLKQPEAGRLLADGLHGVHCRPDLASALADREALGEGEAFVTPAGHLVTAQGVTFFAPDSELHGVIARQRELDELATLIATATTVAAAARGARDAVDEDLKAKQQTWHAEGLAVGSQQRRVHDLELELVTLKQAAEAAERRRAQIAQETADVAAQESGETAQRDAIARRSPTSSRGCTRKLPPAKQRATPATKPRSNWPAGASACALRSAPRRRPDSPNAAVVTGWPSSSAAANR